MHDSGFSSVRFCVGFFVVVLGVVLVASESRSGSEKQAKKIGEAVPGFYCSEMVVEPSGSTWSLNGSYHRMTSALWMPEACLLALRQRIRVDRNFSAQRCNIVERCWQRTDTDRIYTFTFYPAHTSFKYEWSRPPGLVTMEER